MTTNHSISPPKNHFKPINQDHILKINTDLIEKETYLRERLHSEIQQNKKIECENLSYKKEFKRLRTFIVFIIISSILSHFLFYCGITILIASPIVYYSSNKNSSFFANSKLYNTN